MVCLLHTLILASRMLISLREKLATCAQQSPTETVVLYLLVEIGKYIERGNDPRFREENGNRFAANELPAIKFFRDWVAHPSKVRNGTLDVAIRDILHSRDFVTSEGSQLFSLLKCEMSEFAERLGFSFPPDLWWDAFNESLRRILSEQPIILRLENGTTLSYAIDSTSLQLRRL